MIITTKLTNKVDIIDGNIIIKDMDFINTSMFLLVARKLYTTKDFVNINTNEINQFDKNMLKLMIIKGCIDVYENSITNIDINNNAISNL